MYSLTRLEAQQLANQALGGVEAIPHLVTSALQPLQTLPGMRTIAVLWSIGGGTPRGLLAGAPQWLPIHPGSLRWADLVPLLDTAGSPTPAALLESLGLPQPGPGDESILLPLGSVGLLLAIRRPPAAPCPPLASIFRDRAALLGSLLPLAGLEWLPEDGATPPPSERTAHSSEALARLSHELRGPLSVIAGYALVLTQDPPASPVRTRFIEQIRNEAVHLSSLVEDVLVYTDLDLGRTPMNPAPLRLDRAIAEVVTECATTLGVPRSRVQLDLHGLGVQETLVDGPRFRRIVGSLICNALQQDTVNPIRLSAERDGERVVVEVEDHGTGIPDTQVESVFEPFMMPASHGPGRGLGMAIAHAMAQRMGGSLSLRHTGRSGTRFSLVLPLPVATEGGAVRSSAVPDLEGRRVLLVEDSPEIQFILREYLRPTKAILTQIYDGQSAVNQVLAMAAAGRPADLMLMDHQLPELDGYSATRKLRQHFPNLPIIAITGAGIETNRQLAERSGCTAWLPKPIKPADFYRTLSTLLETPSTNSAPAAIEAGQDAHEPAPPSPLSSLAELPDLDFQEDLRERYRSRLVTRLETLAESRQTQDLASARRIAHQLRGSAASFGYATLGGYAERAEEAIIQGRAHGQVEARLDELADEIRRVLSADSNGTMRP